MRRQSELIRALSSVGQGAVEFDSWIRSVDYKYSNLPLSVAGSVKGVGGRFNIGLDVDTSITPPFPALYIADSYETAHREQYQAPSGGVDGLSPEDLALVRSGSKVRVRGHVQRVIDISKPQNLDAICRVLAKIEMPKSVAPIMRRLKVARKDVFMIRTPTQLGAALQDQNWRTWPIQFGIPSPSQQFAELAKSAGFEGIVYRSSKNPNGKCLALFADSLGSDQSYIELMDAFPAGVIARLDLNSIDALR